MLSYAWERSEDIIKHLRFSFDSDSKLQTELIHVRCYYACEKNGAHTKWQKFGFKIIMLETLVKHDCFLQPRIKILKDSLYDAYKGPYNETFIYKLVILYHPYSINKILPYESHQNYLY